MNHTTRIAIAAFLLLAEVSWAEVPTITCPAEYDAIRGRALRETSLDTYVSGDFPILCEWFRGAPETGWDGTAPLPEGIELIETQTFETAPYDDGNPRALSGLDGFKFFVPTQLWLRASNTDGQTTANIQVTVHNADSSGNKMGSGIPVFIEWTGVLDAYAPGTHISSLVNPPGLRFGNYGNWQVTLYEGATGDVSKPFATYLEYKMDDRRVSSLRDFILEDTMQIWAQVQTTETSIDVPAVTLVVQPADGPIEFVNWPEAVTDLYGNTMSTFRAELNLPPTATTFQWFWGESGDTSHRIRTPDGAYSLYGLDTINVLTPTGEATFWVQATTNGSSIDSPTARFTPRPPESPVILHQPEDVTRTTFWAHFFLEIEASGGDLTVQWYRGSRGDTSEPILYDGDPSFLDGNVMNFEFTNLYDEVWARVSNHLGIADTRTVSIHSPGEDGVWFLEQPRRVQIRSVPFPTDSIVQCFGFRTTALMANSEIQFLEGDDWVTVANYPVLVTDGSGPEANAYFQVLKDAYYALPSGTYRLQVGDFGAESFRSERFTVVNHLLEGTDTPQEPRIQLRATSGILTEGGLYRAKVALNFPYQDFQVFAGSLGDTTQPVPTDVNAGTVYDPVLNGFSHPQVLVVKWMPRAESTYWLQVSTTSDEEVSAVVKYPDAFALAESVLAGQEAYSIRLPVGENTVPLPRLPDEATWFLDADQTHPIAPPITIDQLPGASTTLNAILSNAPAGSEAIRVEVSVDEAEPPRLSREPAKVLVDWNGHILWAGTVDGTTERTTLFVGTESTDLGKYAEVAGSFSRGLPIPTDSDWIRFEWKGPGGIRSLERPVTRLPTEVEEAIGLERVDEGIFYTEEFGSFLAAWHYPWVFHHELGWWYLQIPLNGVFFYGITASSGASWNWTTKEIYPYFYNFETASWRFYLEGSGNYFYDFVENRWDALGGS